MPMKKCVHQPKALKIHSPKPCELWDEHSALSILPGRTEGLGQGEAAVDNQGIAALLLLLPVLNLIKIHSGFVWVCLFLWLMDLGTLHLPGGWDFNYHPRLSCLEITGLSCAQLLQHSAGPWAEVQQPCTAARMQPRKCMEHPGLALCLRHKSQQRKTGSRAEFLFSGI